MITTIEPSLEVRGAIIAALKGDVQLEAIVGERIYPPKTPATLTWPFIRLGVLSSAPLRPDGGFGGDVSGVVHCFTKLDSATVPDPEAQARQINAHIARVLDAIGDTAISPLALAVHVTLAQVFDDPSEADAWHGVVSIEASAT